MSRDPWKKIERKIGHETEPLKTSESALDFGKRGYAEKMGGTYPTDGNAGVHEQTRCSAHGKPIKFELHSPTGRAGHHIHQDDRRPCLPADPPDYYGAYRSLIESAPFVPFRNQSTN